MHAHKRKYKRVETNWVSCILWSPNYGKSSELFSFRSNMCEGATSEIQHPYKPSAEFVVFEANKWTRSM